MKENSVTLDRDTLHSLQQDYPHYYKAMSYFAEQNIVLAMSAACTYQMNWSGLKKIVEPLLAFIEGTAGADYLQSYQQRVRQLMTMQQQFNTAPSLASLGDLSQPADRLAYNVTLLASIVFTNHRYEIMDQLNAFIQMVKKPTGVMACVGMGTGYETMLAAKQLAGWTIEGYDTDTETHVTAGQLLDFFGCRQRVTLHHEFELYDLEHSREAMYDAIIFSEILEHLTDPLTALKSLKRAIKPDGYIFLTMAINIAQEDHIYWYPDIDACREQIADAGLVVMAEKISPITRQVIGKAQDRAANFSSGNYIALVSRQA